MHKRLRKHVFQIAGMGLLAVAITLGVFQVRWITKAVEAEESRISREIRLNVEKVVGAVFDEMRALMSFALPTTSDIENENWDGVLASTGLWRESSNFPDLLKNVFILPTETDGNFYQLDIEQNDFVFFDPLIQFETYMEAIADSSMRNAIRQIEQDSQRTGTIIIPISSNPGEVSGWAAPPVEDTQAVLVFSMDTKVLFGDILTYYLEQYAGEYPYRIIRNGEIFQYSGLKDGDTRKPDLTVPLSPVYSASLTNLEQPVPKDRGKEAKPFENGPDTRNPIRSFWFLRTLGVLNPSELQMGNARDYEVPDRLEIFYPERSLKSAMTMRRAVDLSISIGSLLLLLVGYFILYALLNRTENLRTRERDFVASMSHELRTPISVINATSDNLVHGLVQEPDRVSHYGRLIQLQAQRLGSMVKNIFQYSGLETGDSAHIHISEFDMASLALEIKEFLSLAAEDAGAVIKLSIDAGVGRIKSDPDALRIVIENLLINALRHGVAVDSDASEKAEIRFVLKKRPPASFHIIIEDDGPGIDPSEVNKIFEPFVRGKTSASAQHAGGGLGLHLVKKIVAQLEGSVTLESPYENIVGESQHGTRFIVKLQV